MSEPSYPIRLDAAIEHGADYIKTAPDGRHVRLDVQSTARDAVTGSLLRFTYRGKIATTGPAGRVLRGEEGAGTTDFGEACKFVPFFLVSFLYIYLFYSALIFFSDFSSLSCVCSSLA